MILNLTQHAATEDQVAAGVRDLTGEAKATLVDLLTCPEIPSREEVEARCADIAMLAVLEYEEHPAQAMIGGAPWMMRALEDALIMQGVEPVYAFSVRESIDRRQPDGSVRKEAVFRHAGWIPAR